MPAQPSQRVFWSLALLAFIIAAVILHWRGLPLVLIPETSALIGFVTAAVLQRLFMRLQHAPMK